LVVKRGGKNAFLGALKIFAFCRFILMKSSSLLSFQFLAKSQGEKEAVRASRECPHLRIEIWGTRFCGYVETLPTYPIYFGG
jgi:hypothetical protein